MRAVFLSPIAAFSALAAAVVDARGHDAPSGWHYPISCCSGYDCREVPFSMIHERPEGYVIDTTKEVIPYNDKRIRKSEDDHYHWCSRGGLDTGETICLFTPPMAF